MINWFHECFQVTKVNPLALQLTLILSVARNGAVSESGNAPRGDAFRAMIQIDDQKPFPVECWLKEMETGSKMRPTRWIFLGSMFEGGKCLASQEGNIIDVNSLDQSPILSPSGDDYYDKTSFEAATDEIEAALGRKPGQEAETPNRPPRRRVILSKER